MRSCNFLLFIDVYNVHCTLYIHCIYILTLYIQNFCIKSLRKKFIDDIIKFMISFTYCMKVKSSLNKSYNILFVISYNLIIVNYHIHLLIDFDTYL